MLKIAYLFGAGAAQGELAVKDGYQSILMDDIIGGILNDLSDEDRLQLSGAANNLADDANIEQLITLYETSGIAEKINTAQLLKRLFRQELEKRVLGNGGVYEPGLFAALLDMHTLDELNEQIVLVMTTNYEDLIEQAMKAVCGSINYVIKTESTGDPYVFSDEAIPMLKLHGSFNWKNEYSVNVQNAIGYEQDVTWIPPGVAKSREFYPFDLIWGKARELLDCDVLRIIGSSLGMNDWALVSLVHTTQQLRTNSHRSYTIELIDYPEQCTKIKGQHKYLDITTVLDIPEFKDYFVSAYLPEYINNVDALGGELEKKGLEYLKIPENMFAHWLKAKGEALRSEGVSLNTTKGYFERFVLGG